MRMNKNIPDDLDYLSELGFEKQGLTGDDVEDINKRIDKKVSGSYSGGRIVTGLAVIAVAVLLSWLIVKKYTAPGNKTETPLAVNSQLPESSGGTKIIPAASDTVFPELKTKSAHPVYPKEHFTKENTDVHFNPEMTAEVLPPHDITQIEIKNAEAPKKEMLEMLPNAPVIYIYDLKVTDYLKLYFKKTDPFTIRNGGLTADYENIKGYHPNKNKEEPVYTADMVLKDGLNAFNKAEYGRSLSFFSILLDLNKKDVNALFYSGLSYYHTDKAQNAINMLDRVLENENNVFQQEAEWYKALSLIKNKDTEAAKQLLLKINARQGFYAERAGEKLKEML
ncbi:MAG: tetratricopeptide repeat protein [Bacteroidia bacterium]